MSTEFALDLTDAIHERDRCVGVNVTPPSNQAQPLDLTYELKDNILEKAEKPVLIATIKSLQELMQQKDIDAHKFEHYLRDVHQKERVQIHKDMNALKDEVEMLRARAQEDERSNVVENMKRQLEKYHDLTEKQANDIRLLHSQMLSSQADIFQEIIETIVSPRRGLEQEDDVDDLFAHMYNEANCSDGFVEKSIYVSHFASEGFEFGGPSDPKSSSLDTRKSHHKPVGIQADDPFINDDARSGESRKTRTHKPLMEKKKKADKI